MSSLMRGPSLRTGGAALIGRRMAAASFCPLRGSFRNGRRPRGLWPAGHGGCYLEVKEDRYNRGVSQRPRRSLPAGFLPLPYHFSPAVRLRPARTRDFHVDGKRLRHGGGTGALRRDAFAGTPAHGAPDAVRSREQLDEGAGKLAV